MNTLGAIVLTLFVWGVEDDNGLIYGHEIREYASVEECVADLPLYEGSPFIKAECLPAIEDPH